MNQPGERDCTQQKSVFLSQENSDQFQQGQYSNLIFSQQLLNQSFQVQKTELQTLFDCYLNQGPFWKKIESEIVSTSPEVQDPKLGNPKNYFNNAIRKAANDLNKFQVGLKKNKKSTIQKKTILNLLEVVNQTQKHLHDRGERLNEQSKLYKLKKGILMFSFWQQSFSQEDKTSLIKFMKYLASKLRSLGIFKIKNRKRFKFTLKALRLIQSFDDIVPKSSHSLPPMPDKHFSLSFELNQECSSLSPLYPFSSNAKDENNSQSATKEKQTQNSFSQINVQLPQPHQFSFILCDE